MADIKECLGIPNMGPLYFRFPANNEPMQNIQELIDLSMFVKSTVRNKDIEEFKGKDFNIQLINYGDAQVVAVLTVDNSKQYTLMINQPATEFGYGKKEFDNLIKLNQIDPSIVIKPIHYFEQNHHELYITPYYYQARCIGLSPTDWGIWIPEPKYHFQIFNERERKIINSTMIAMLIKLYDKENNKGISKCYLHGGDFMLLKGFENHEMSFDNIASHIKLIAARELTTISLDDYIDRIKIELSNQEQTNLIITGEKLQCPFTKEEIEMGIEKGIKIRSRN